MQKIEEIIDGIRRGMSEMKKKERRRRQRRVIEERGEDRKNREGEERDGKRVKTEGGRGM